MSVAESQIKEAESEEKTKVKVKAKMKSNVGSPEVRHQLQVMVAGKLADRGISRDNLWNSTTKTKAKLSEQEKERLDRQRYNKRKWAQKERARSKALIDGLKKTNTYFEDKNRQLRREVDKLIQQKLSLRNTLLTHKCCIQNVPKTSVYEHVPFFHRWTKDKTDTRGSQNTRTRIGCPLNSTRKEDIPGGPVSRSLVPATNTGFIMVDEHLGKNSSDTFQHTWLSERPKSHVHIVKQLTARPGTSTETQKGTPIVGKPIETTDAKLTDNHAVEENQSLSSGASESAPSLTSGGFTISNLSESNMSFLQMLQDDPDGKEDSRAAVKKRRTQNEQRNENNQSSSPAKRSAGNMTDKVESGGPSLVLMLPPEPFRQNWVKAEADLQKIHKSGDNTEITDVNSASEHQSCTSESYCKTKQNEVQKTNTAQTSTRASYVPGKSGVALSKSGRHKTRKGVLLERWFAQEHTYGLRKKPTKAAHSRSSQSKMRTQKVTVNPWAVPSPTSMATDQLSLLSSSCNLDSKESDHSEITMNTTSFPLTETNCCSDMSNAIDMTQLIHSAQFGSPPDTEFSTCNKPRSESSVAASSMSHADTDTGVQDSRDFQVYAEPDANMSSAKSRIDADDPSIPSLSDDTPTPTRRMSWPTGETQPLGCLATRPRCLSLPSSFSNVILEDAGSDIQLLCTPQQLMDMLSFPEHANIEFVSSLAANHNVLLTKSNNFLGLPLPSEADAAVLSPTSCLIAEDFSSTPSSSSSPPPDCLFGNGSGLVSKDSNSGSRLAKVTRDIDQQYIKEEKEPTIQAEFGSSWDKGQVEEGSRVKVERVPDADIATWQAMYEMPILSEQMDEGMWQPTAVL